MLSTELAPVGETKEASRIERAAGGLLAFVKDLLWVKRR